MISSFNPISEYWLFLPSPKGFSNRTWAHFTPTLVNWVLKKDYYLHI